MGERNWIITTVRALDWLRSAAADATSPGHRERVAAGAQWVSAELKAKRGGFSLQDAVEPLILSGAEAHDAAAVAYRRLCEHAADDDVITPVERDTLAWAAKMLRLTDRDTRTIHDLVAMPPSVDRRTAGLVTYPRGRAIGTKSDIPL